MWLLKKHKAKKRAEVRQWDALGYLMTHFKGSLVISEKYQYIPQSEEQKNSITDSSNIKYSLPAEDAVREKQIIIDYYAWEKSRKTTETFSRAVLRMIEEKGMTPQGFYKKAGMDRKLFSKLNTDPDYQPNKKTAIRCCLALELEPEVAIKLLGSAGYTLAATSPFDLAIRYCIENRVYDLMEVEELLDILNIQTL